MLVSHRKDMFRRSKSFMSPLSYPAHTHRSWSLKAWPTLSLIQSKFILNVAGKNKVTCKSFAAHLWYPPEYLLCAESMNFHLLSNNVHTKCNCPAVPFGLSFHRLHVGYRWIFLSGIPYLHSSCKPTIASSISGYFKCIFNMLWLKHLIPSLLPVTISGAPSPIPRPPTPSILFTISLWAFTE